IRELVEVRHRRWCAVRLVRDIAAIVVCTGHTLLRSWIPASVTPSPQRSHFVRVAWPMLARERLSRGWMERDSLYIAMTEREYPRIRTWRGIVAGCGCPVASHTQHLAAKTRGILRQRAVVIVTCGDVKQSFTWMRPDTSPAVSACTAPGIAGSLVWDVRDDVSAIADRRVVDIHPKTHHSVAWRRAETGQHVDVHEPVCRELGIDRYSKHSGLP